MTGDKLFYRDENKALISICARKLISQIGIGAIFWGAINIILGITYIHLSNLNVVLLILGVLMLGTGIKALIRPSLGVLMTETIVAIGLFAWNLAVSLIEYRAGNLFAIRHLIPPLIFAAIFVVYYCRLGHLRKQISSIEPEKIKAAGQACKALLKKKLKNEPLVVQTKDSRCRAQLMDEKALFIQKNMRRAFMGSKEDIREAVLNPDSKRLKLYFKHPLGRLKYQFDRKNSEKLKDWFSIRSDHETESTAILS